MIAVAMSGGVDSSTVAALLQAQGEPIVGLTMQLWNQRRLAGAPGMAPSARGRCCSLDDVHDARRVAEQLGIPYYVVNFEEQFERDVVRNFVAEYRAGRTPVPCSHCNTAVKFHQLLATARQIGAEAVATGHYARVRYNEEQSAYELVRAVDEAKDQTFFLWGLTQEQLAAARFPLGAMRKPEVRAQAAAFGLSVAEKPDSNEICFVPGNNYAAFLDAYAAEQGESATAQSGELVATDGRVLAHHGGVEHFTVGQRKGLGVASGSPLYVLQVDAAAQRVTVGSDAELRSNHLEASGCNWISGDAPSGPVRVQARIRHRHTPAAAWAEPKPGARVSVVFDEPQRAITPGQSVVLYDGETVLGGAWID
ncbi:MAG: tRNA 2-thiouridine(34) synthase MnmA [Terriglobales bacterium]